MQYFLGSYIVTAIGFVLAYLWGEHLSSGTGWMSIFIVFVLSILEVSLSFDNAVINALKLEKMNEKWRRRFLTWGIAIAVFGMRFLFPILVVAIFAKLTLFNVAKIALTDAQTYAHYLHETHAPIVAFGGMFLLMLYLTYFYNEKKEVHWIKKIEKNLATIGDMMGLETIIALSTLYVVQLFIPQVHRLDAVISGMSGVVIFLIIDGFTNWLEKREKEAASSLSGAVRTSGLIGFLYLELIDASFSLDGVLGAFALSKDILIITIGLSIGAMFVRSLTMMLVEKRTLNKYLYLEHGAHWAIGALAVIMLVSTFHEVPEVVTGLIGLTFIVAAYISSILHNKEVKAEEIN